MFHASLTEACFFHPGYAIGAGVVEAAGGFDEHVQAHEQTESILGAIVIDDAVIDNERAALGNGFEALADQDFLFLQIPVVQDVSHHYDIGLGQILLKETAGPKCDARGETVGGNVFLKRWRHFRQIETCAVPMSTAVL